MSAKWIPLYPGDYLRDTSALTMQQHGAYLQVLLHYYVSGPIPTDAAAYAVAGAAVSTLHRVCGAFTKGEREDVQFVLGKFFYQDGDFWRHKRADAEIAESAKRSANAREKANLRWQKDAQPDAPAYSGASAGAMPGQMLEGMPDGCYPQPQPQKEIKDIGHLGHLACPYERLVDAYHQCMPDNPRVRKLTDARRRQLRARWNECHEPIGKSFGYATVDEGVEKWRQFFQVCALSEFLTGRTTPQPGRAPFVADLEWLTASANFIRILENKYHRESQPVVSGGRFAGVK